MAVLGMEPGVRLVCGVLQASTELTVQAWARLLVCIWQEGCSSPQRALY